MSGQFEFHSPYWDNISNEAKDLIRRLLVVQPEKRLSAKQALKHEWFTTKNSSSKRMHKNFHTELSRHNSRRKSAVRPPAPVPFPPILTLLRLKDRGDKATVRHACGEVQGQEGQKEVGHLSPRCLFLFLGELVYSCVLEQQTILAPLIMRVLY
jgi:serine/threonine protein kinase